MDNNATDAKLAALLQQYPAIWDRKSTSFKNRTMKDNSFQKLAAELKISVQVCEERYKSIREKFRKEKLKETEETKSGAGQCTERWELYETLSFLNDQILSRRKRVTTFKEPNNDTASSTASDTQLSESQATQNEIIWPAEDEVTIEGSDTVLSTPSSHTSIEIPRSSLREETPLPRTKKQKVQGNEELTAMVNTLTQAASNVSAMSSKSTRFTWLGRYITETLDSMDSRDAEEAAHEITELLFKRKMNSMK